MVVKCEINLLNNPLGTYFAGQVISGSVVLSADTENLVKAVVLQIKGYASTCWTDSTTDSDNKTTEESYSGHEDYIKSKIELICATETNEIAIEPGEHVYNFACQIPTVCPSSFEGTHGRVRYLVNVKIIRPWKVDQIFSRPFTVLKVMDLNREGLFLRTEAYSEDQKIYNCWPCRSEPLRLHLSLPQRGFVPGQTIPVGVRVTNDSHIRVEEIKARLVMIVLYYSQHSIETISERFVVSKKTGEGVTKNCEKQFTFDLNVPATPPTCFDLCRIIQIAYQVEVETKVKGWHINKRVHMPVTIGNVPLTKLLQQQPRATPIEVEVVAQQLDEKALVLLDNVDGIVPVAAPNPWAVDSSIPLPSYAEAMHIPLKSSKSTTDQTSNHDKDKTTGTQNKEDCVYAPLYAVFNTMSQDEQSGRTGEDVDRSTWF